MRNRRREWDIDNKCTKTARQVLANIAKQTVTPALVTYFESVKKINAVAYCYLVSVYATMVHRLKITDVGHHLSHKLVTNGLYFLIRSRRKLASCILLIMLHLLQQELDLIAHQRSLKMKI